MGYCVQVHRWIKPTVVRVWASCNTAGLTLKIVYTEKLLETKKLKKLLKLLKFQDIRSLQLGQFVFSYKNSALPTSFNNLF